MKTPVNKLESIAKSYNALVKSDYEINEEGAEYLMLNEMNEGVAIPYHEISSNTTLSGHAEIFEPEL